MRTTLGGLIFLSVFSITGSAHASGLWRADDSNTRGWQFMTAEERIAHQARIRGFKSYEECQSYQVEHHGVMEERAKQQGRVLAPGRQNFCEHLKPAGRTR
jgi:hypothetical protein